MAILMRHRQLDKERACYIARFDAIRIWLEMAKHRACHKAKFAAALFGFVENLRTQDYVTKLLLIDVRTSTPIHGFSN